MALHTIQHAQSAAELILGSCQVAISKLDRVAPTVRIPGGDLTVLRSWTVILSSSAAVPSDYAYNATSQTCTAATQQPSQLGFQWSADPAGPNFDFASLPAAFAVTQSSPQLAIPPNWLQVRCETWLSAWLALVDE